MKTSYRSIFPQKLKFYLAQYQLSQIELSKRIGASPAAVSHWLNGVKVPSPENVDRLCEVFHCRRTDLLEPGPSQQTVSELQRAFSELSPQQQKVVTDMINLYIEHNRRAVV